MSKTRVSGINPLDPRFQANVKEPFLTLNGRQRWLFRLKYPLPSIRQQHGLQELDSLPSVRQCLSAYYIKILPQRRIFHLVYTVIRELRDCRQRHL